MTSEDPRVLYRYRHLQGEHREWTKRILTDSVLHFAKPSLFNDPFDCKVHFRPSFSREELKQKYVDLVKKNIPELNQKKNAFGKTASMFIDKFKVVYLIIFTIILLGAMTYSTISKESMPDVSLNMIFFRFRLAI